MKTKKSNLLIYIIIFIVILSFLTVGFITNWHFFANKETLELSDRENLFKKMMDEHYKNIFPNNTNRNAAGFRFFQYIYDNLATSNELFDVYNQFYCAVSGAIVSPGQDNFSILKVKDLNGNCVFGKYYRCCTPCDCDIMKYTRIIKAEISIPKDSNNKYFKNFITIGDPCIKESEIPEEMDKKILKCRNNLSDNGYRINENGEITKENGRLIIGVLYPITSEETKNIENSVQGCITGNKRFLSSPENLKYGMGDIFVKLALLNDSYQYTHTEEDFCNNTEEYLNENIKVSDIPLKDADNIFNNCVYKVEKKNYVNKKDLIICSHQYCANMRSTSSDGGAIVTNLIPLEPLNGSGPTKNFYVSVCCTSDYCKMVFEKSHKYKKVGNNYYLVKTNSKYGNKIVQILFTESEDEIKDGRHITGLSGNLSLDQIRKICKI